MVKGHGFAKLMEKSNLHTLDINLIAAMSNDNEEESSIQVSEIFSLSPWYSDIIYVLKNLSPPPGMTRNKARTLKLKASKFCILNSALYWKDPGGILLNCLVEKEAKKFMEDCHQGDCGGHLFWKSTTNKILRAGYYWLTLLIDVYKMVKRCHKCQIFEGKWKLQPLPLKPIELSSPFQQWGLDFIGKIHLNSSGQHRWIVISTNYFTKWIEAIPTRKATGAVIISFLENNILSRFGCPNKLIIDNTAAFKSTRMVEFCHKYHIILGHSTAYHLQGNGLAESSNKSLKKLIGTSPFELVYGVDIVLPTSLTTPVVKLLQEDDSEEDPMQRRLNQMVHLQQTRQEVFKNTSKLEEKIKKIYDKKAKVKKFQVDDVVLKWDARNE
eukprot:PITA_34282